MWLPIWIPKLVVVRIQWKFGVDIEHTAMCCPICCVAHEICDKVMSTCRCKVMLQMNVRSDDNPCWQEGCNAYCYKQNQLMEGVDNVLLYCNRLRVLFQSLISSFSLSITFGMISEWSELHVQRSSKDWKKWDTNSEPQSKWRARDTVLGKDV